MATPISSSTSPALPVQSAAVNKNDGNFKGAIDGDSAVKPGGRGGISGDVGISDFEKNKKVADSANNIGGDDLFE